MPLITTSKTESKVGSIEDGYHNANITTHFEKKTNKKNKKTKKKKKKKKKPESNARTTKLQRDKE